MTSPERSDVRMEIDLHRLEVTLHVTPEGIELLREALDGAERGDKVLLGDKPLLIIRPLGWKP